MCSCEGRSRSSIRGQAYDTSGRLAARRKVWLAFASQPRSSTRSQSRIRSTSIFGDWRQRALPSTPRPWSTKTVSNRQCRPWREPRCMRRSSRRRTRMISSASSALSSIHRNRGKVLGKQGKPTEALQELRTAVGRSIERIASNGRCVPIRSGLFALAMLRDRGPARGETSMRNAMPIRHSSNCEMPGARVGSNLRESKGIPTWTRLRDRPQFRAFLESVGGSADRPKP